MKAKDVMSKNVFCCTPEDSIQKAALLMRDHDVGAVPVVNDCNERKLLGIVTDRDVCVKVVAAGKTTNSINVSEVMTKRPFTCGPDDSIEACEAIMETNQVRRVPVVDSRGVCMGIIAQADIALRDTAEHAYRTIAGISKHRAQPQRQMAASA